MALFERPPGPWIAPIKDHLRELVIDGELDMADKAAAGTIGRYEQNRLIAKVRPEDSFVGSKRVICREQNENPLAPQRVRVDG